MYSGYFQNNQHIFIGDDSAAVAGRLDDASIHLMGAYRVIHNDVMVPPPPVSPQPPVGPEG